MRHDQLLWLCLATLCASLQVAGQSPAAGLPLADMSAQPMQPLANPGLLDTVHDPAFGTVIRRISDAAPGERIVPMYSTIQAWNADESLMILYEVGTGHRLHDGQTYAYLGMLPIQPLDLEQVFWDHDDPEVFYYPRYDAGLATTLYVAHNVTTGIETSLVDLGALAPDCANGGVRFGNDVQMPSRDDDVIGFRCQSSGTYLHRISTGVTTQLSVPNNDLRFIAAMPSASGTRGFHITRVYDAATGAVTQTLNKEDKSEHSCLGTWADGTDGYFTVAFAQGPQGGCIGQLIGHDLATGACYDLVAQSGGWPYPRTGTHISALAHQAEAGWLAVSMIGDPSGAGVREQELLLVRARKTGAEVYRIGHHRSDEDPVDYWGEPHAVLSPSGTRVLFGSDWGAGGGAPAAVNSYVVELPSFGLTTPLPVTLSHLSAKQVAGNRIAVTWTSAEEMDIDHYQIELGREDGSPYWLAGKHTGLGEGAYSFKTAALVPGEYYVRLRTVSLDGSSELSETVAVRIVDGQVDVQLVSDASSRFRLDFRQAAAGFEMVRVYDALGRLQYSELASGDWIDARAWPVGTYTVRVAGRSWRWVKR